MTHPSNYYAGGHTPYQMQNLAGVDSRIANVVSTVRARTASGGSVLDLGCGDMYLKTLLPEFQYTGVDVDTAKAPTAICHDLSITPYPFSDASFDTIICSEVLEHLWEPESALKELYRTLKPGGTLVLTVPNFDSIDAQLTHHQHMIYDKKNVFSVEHIRQYTPQSMSALVTAEGFEVRNLLGNSAHMSGFFEGARVALNKVMKSNGVQAGPSGIDQVIGLMFPTLCPGFMLEARKK